MIPLTVLQLLNRNRNLFDCLLLWSFWFANINVDTDVDSDTDTDTDTDTTYDNNNDDGDAWWHFDANIFDIVDVDVKFFKPYVSTVLP